MLIKAFSDQISFHFCFVFAFISSSSVEHKTAVRRDKYQISETGDFWTLRVEMTSTNIEIRGKKSIARFRRWLWWNWQDLVALKWETVRVTGWAQKPWRTWRWGSLWEATKQEINPDDGSQIGCRVYYWLRGQGKGEDPGRKRGRETWETRLEWQLQVDPQ